MTTTTFGRQAWQVHNTLRQQGGQLHDMRSSDSLELRLGTGLASDGEGAAAGGERIELLWLEPSSPFGRPVQPMIGQSPVRYFLDGAQQTLPGYHFAAVPILASVNSAAILERKSPSDLRIMPEMIALNRSWLAPKRTENAEIDRFIRCAEVADFEVIDPLADLNEKAYRAKLGDYAALEQAALASSRLLRSQLELRLLQQWRVEMASGDDWIIVDGALREMAPRAIGLVKSFTRQYVSGEQAEQLFRLPARYRSPAFAIEDKWRCGQFAVWYLRFWDAAGRDPRHSLVRVEVADPSISPEGIEAISSWLLAERRPRATADSRWPTLLYPIHYLERILKRYMVRETQYWPGVRGAG